MSSIEPSKTLIAVVDCNCFYVSCERVFNPKLKDKPVVVLSNNDGCIVARSNEAKALNIPMGAPLFKYKTLFETQNVFALSSNYSLYGDLSARVMEILRSFAIDIEVYSIDEAFITLPFENVSSFCQEIRERILKWVGIPVSIGVSTTKTLAKVAVDIAKKNISGISILIDQEEINNHLKKVDVSDVWGIGGQLKSKLHSKGIFSAYQFKSQEESFLKKIFSVLLVKTAYELNGVSCLSLDEAYPPKKSVVRSRSFSHPLEKQEEIGEALSSFVSMAAENIRKEGQVANGIEVFLETSRFQENAYSNSLRATFKEPTSYTPLLIGKAKELLSQIFIEGLLYKKVGVHLIGLQSSRTYQRDFFAPQENLKRNESLMILLDDVNKKFGKESVKFAAVGIEQDWKRKQELSSKRYTSSWEDLLEV